MLTIQIMFRNHYQTIENTLLSLQSLNAKIFAIDIGSTDNTIEILHKFKAKIVKETTKDRAKIRNKYQTDDWNLIINPWEVIINGYDFIQEAMESQGNYRIMMLQGDIITKPIRLWKGKKQFSHCVYESLLFSSRQLNSYWSGSGSFGNEKELINQWQKEKPTAMEPYYYQAFDELSNGNHEEFIKLIKKYLFLTKSGEISQVMANYYLALVYCYYEKKFQEALEILSYCLSKHVLMAEFWCLVGDIYFQSRNYAFAQIFYENAIVLGSFRLNEDEYPIQISKYKSYPEEMIEKCKIIRERLKNVGRSLER